jgi:hypothetical protein
MYAVAGSGCVGEGIRQVGCQTNEEDRSVEAQTDEVERAHKHMQFYHGDDTDFLEALKRAAIIAGTYRGFDPFFFGLMRDMICTYDMADEVERADKHMQFYHGDDTDFLEALKRADIIAGRSRDSRNLTVLGGWKRLVNG